MVNMWSDSSASVALQVIDAANEVVDSIDRDELAKFFSLRTDPEDEEAEVCSCQLILFIFSLLNPCDLISEITLED